VIVDVTVTCNCTYRYEHYDIGVYISASKQYESTQLVNPAY
jgi:hypothetical protein